MAYEATDKTCPLCGGAKRPGTTTFSADLGFGVIVIRQVPALLCSQCGADWIDDATAAHIEALVENPKRKRSLVEVMAYS